jgi:hypothetical protein
MANDTEFGVAACILCRRVLLLSNRLPLAPIGRPIGGPRLPLDRDGPVVFDNPFDDGETPPRQRGEP